MRFKTKQTNNSNNAVISYRKNEGIRLDSLSMLQTRRKIEADRKQRVFLNADEDRGRQETMGLSEC